jgi:hypothetical protein
MKEKIFYVIVCEEAGICGAFCTKKEAKEYNELIKSCPAKHKIKKCIIKMIENKQTKGKKIKDKKCKEELIRYIKLNPELRLGQAIANYYRAYGFNVLVENGKENIDMFYHKI